MSDNHMATNLDTLLEEAIAQTLFAAEEDGELVREDGELDSGDELKRRHKKSRHKSKHKTPKAKTSKTAKTTKTSSKSKKSESGDKTSGKSEKCEKTSKAMKLLLSKKLTTYAGIEFKEEVPIDTIDKTSKSKSSAKHKTAKSDDNKRHKKSSSKHSSSGDYETQNYSYYSTKSSTQHEDYFYGSYYEGMNDMPRRGGDYYSRPLSPLYETEWKYRSRSRSPIDYRSSDRSGDDRRDERQRSLSPENWRNDRRDDRHRSLSPPHDSRSRRRSTRSVTPFYKDSYKYKTKKPDTRRSLSPTGGDRHVRRRSDRCQSMEPIDKQQLYEIARNNLIKMIESGDLPKGTDVNKLRLRHLRELTTQKSVQQWTEFCRAISALEEAVSSDSDLDSDYDSDAAATTAAPATEDSIFSIRHPFKLKERKDIQIHVRNFNQLPSRTAKEMALELREQFPVSSGNQHRRKELEWHEVPDSEAMPPPPPPPPLKAKKCEPKASTSTAPVGIPAPDIADDIQKAFTFIQTTRTDANVSVPAMASATPSSSATVQSAADSTTTETSGESEGKTTSDSVFPQSAMPIDIGSVMAQRLNAMRKLEADPHNVVALKQMYQANQMMTEWAESKIVPGQFIGSTGANVLTPEQLNGACNAWTRKDQLKTAAPITGGVGMHLLMRMGWCPGQGLGKNNEGPVDPIALDIKMDKKGLVAEEELVRNLPAQLVSKRGATDGAGGVKNPVSMLYEMCAKRKVSVPVYEQVSEEGPAHRKNFTFKVIMGGVEYQPSVSSANKKLAKALAASVCLQSLGLLPKNKI